MSGGVDEQDDNKELETLLTKEFKEKLKGYEQGKNWLNKDGKYQVYLDDRKQARVGHGHLVLEDDDLEIGDLITEEQANELLDDDLTMAAQECMENFSNNWDLIPFEKKQVLIGMQFQLGTFIVNSFIQMRYAINVQDWQEAGLQIKESQWYNDNSPYSRYKEASVEWSKIMSFEGKMEQLNDEKGDINDVLHSIKHSNMNQMYGLKIDSKNRKIEFIGKHMIDDVIHGNDKNESKTENSKDEIDTTTYPFENANILLNGETTWFHFYTFLLLFYEKGLCDTISFSLNIDGKVDKNQIEPHRLKKVYFPESHLRWSKAGEVMFQADWFIKTLLYDLDPKMTNMMKNYQSFVELSFKYEEMRESRKEHDKHNNNDNNNKNEDGDDDDDEDESEYESVTGTGTATATATATETTRVDALIDNGFNGANNTMTADNEEWHRLWIVISTFDQIEKGESIWIDNIHFKIKIKRLNVTDDGDLKDTDTADESPILQQFIDNINQNMDILETQSNLLKNLANVYRALMFAKFIYQNNVPIDIDMIKQIILKQKVELRSQNLEFTLPAFKASYQQTTENKIRRTLVTREMFFEGGIDLCVNESKLINEKDEKTQDEIYDKMEAILVINKQKNDNNDNGIVLNLNGKNPNNENKNVINAQRMKAALKHFIVEMLPNKLLFSLNNNNNNNNDNKNKGNQYRNWSCDETNCETMLFWEKRLVYEGKKYCSKHYEMARYSKCHKCSKMMDGCNETWMSVENGSLSFHDSCFRCYQCDKLLNDKSFELEKDTSKLFCSLECLHRSHNENEKDRFVKCYQCNETIDKWTTNEPLTGIRKNEYIFHSKCFTCYHCKKHLEIFYEFESASSNDSNNTHSNSSSDEKWSESKLDSNEDNDENRIQLSLYCSLECKYESDGKCSKDRYGKCYGCDKSIDKWKVNEDVMTVNSMNDGEILFHTKCFSCFYCQKALTNYFEFENELNNNKKHNNKHNNKKSILLCSIECKHRLDGDSEDTRYANCFKCKNKIDTWSSEAPIAMIHDGNILFHAKCFECFTCHKKLTTFFECNVNNENGQLGFYLFCSPECQPKNAVWVE